jgi:hypothetical protein
MWAMRTELRLVLALGAAVTVLAACGGSEDSDSEPASGGAAPTTTEQSPARRDRGRTQGEREKDRAGSDREAEREGVRRLSPAERGRDQAQVRDVVEELVAARNERDASVCTRLFDQHLNDPDERGEIVAACERGIEAETGRLELVEIEFIRLREKDGVREALVQFVLRQQRRRLTRFGFHLILRDGGYRIDRPFAVKQPGA